MDTKATLTPKKRGSDHVHAPFTIIMQVIAYTLMYTAMSTFVKLSAEIYLIRELW